MAILVTWNPESPDFDRTDMPEASKLTLSGELYKDWWNVGRSTKKVFIGCRLFVLRQGVKPKGIVGSGWAVSSPKPRIMPKSGKTQQAVDAVFDLMLDPAKYPPLDWHEFTNGPLSKVKWTTQISGISVPDEFEEAWKGHVQTVLGYLPVAMNDGASDADEREFPEGKSGYRLHRHLERSGGVVKEAKERAKRAGQFFCWVGSCGFNFIDRYGEDFIEAHHTIPVHKLGEDATTKATDIAMVCSNCHRMLHRKRPWLSMEELRQPTALLRPQR